MYRYNQTFLQKYWGWSIPIALALVFTYFAWPRQHVAEIVGIEWTRYYQIQILKTVTHYNDETPPSGARIFNEDSSYECTGEGKDEECEWETEYDYEIEEYVNNRVVAANALHPVYPYWPQYTLSGPSGEPYGVGHEVIGQAVERYTLTFKAKDGTTYTDDLPMSEWMLYMPHQVVYLTISLGHVVKIRQLES